MAGVIGTAGRESQANIAARQQLVARLPEFRALLGNIVVDGILKRYQKALYARSSEHAAFALEALEAKLKAPPQPIVSGESTADPAAIIFNEVPMREIPLPAKGWYEDLGVDDEVLQGGQWWKIIRVDTDNTGKFLVWADPSVKFPSMGRQAGEGRIRPWQVRVARRNGIEFSESVPYVPVPPQSVEPAPPPPPVIRRTSGQLAAMKMFPHFDWPEYEAAVRRENDAKFPYRHLTLKERLEAISDLKRPLPKDNRTEEQKMEDQATIAQGNALIASTSSLDDYKLAVWAGYGSMQKSGQVTENQLLNMAKIAHHYGLNPTPGLDLIYLWPDANSKQVRIVLSYKAWLALGLRFKKFVYKHIALSTEEVVKRGNTSDTIVVKCQVVDYEAAHKALELKNMGMDINPNDFIIEGIGVWKKGDAVPKGRDGEWVAKKRSTKDAMTQLIAAAYNLNMPQVDMDFDPEQDGWISPAPAKDEPATPPMDVDQQVQDMIIEGEFTAPEEVLEAAPVATEQPAASESDAPQVKEVKPRFSPSQLKTKFDQAVNALLEKWNKEDNPDRAKLIIETEALLVNFADICHPADARQFIASLIGKQVNAAHAEILKAKILNSPEQAKLEIADYLKVYGDKKAEISEQEAKV